MVHFHQTYDDKLSIQDRNQSFWPTDLGCEYQFICQQQSQKSASWDSGKGMDIHITSWNHCHFIHNPAHRKKRLDVGATVSSKAVCL